MIKKSQGYDEQDCQYCEQFSGNIFDHVLTSVQAFLNLLFSDRNVADNRTAAEGGKILHLIRVYSV